MQKLNPIYKMAQHATVDLREIFEISPIITHHLVYSFTIFYKNGQHSRIANTSSTVVRTLHRQLIAAWSQYNHPA